MLARININVFHFIRQIVFIADAVVVKAVLPFEFGKDDLVFAVFIDEFLAFIKNKSIQLFFSFSQSIR